MIIKPSHISNPKNYPGVLVAQSNTNEGILKSGELIVLCDGINYFLDFLQKEMPFPKRAKSSSETGDPGFHAFPTYDSCIDTFKNNPQSLVDFDPTDLGIYDFNESGNDVEYDVTGDFIDVGRHLEGIPESMGSMHNGKVRDRRIRIIIGGGHAWFTQHKDIKKQSKRICRLIDSLERSGFRCEILAIDSGGSSHNEVVVKHFDEPLSIENVAIASHPEWLRRLVFRTNEYSETWSSGYGSSTLLDQNIKQIVETSLNDEITIYIAATPTERDRSFDKLEKMLELELSLSEPEHSLFYLNDSNVTAYSF